MSLKQHGSLCRWICSLQWTFISFSHIEGIMNDDLRGTLRLHSPRSPVNNNVPVLWHFRKSKLNRTQLNRTRLKVKTDAKDDHGKTHGDINVTPRTEWVIYLFIIVLVVLSISLQSLLFIMWGLTKATILKVSMVVTMWLSIVHSEEKFGLKHKQEDNRNNLF